MLQTCVLNVTPRQGTTSLVGKNSFLVAEACFDLRDAGLEPAILKGAGLNRLPSPAGSSRTIILLLIFYFKYLFFQFFSIHQLIYHHLAPFLRADKIPPI